MKKVLPIFLLSFVLSLNSFSQGPGIQWQKALGGSGTEKTYSVVQTRDGGYITVGESNSNNADVTGNHGGEDYWVVKLSSTGVIQWQKSYGGSNDDIGYHLTVSPDGGYLIAGFSYSNDGNVTGHHGTTQYADLWVLKIDSIGAIQWEKSYGGSGEERATCVIGVADGYVLNAQSNSTDGDVSGNHGGNDYWILKLDKSGNIQWENSYGGSGDDLAQQILATKEGGYIACGYVNSSDGQVSGNHGGYDYWIVKLSNAGAIEWQKSYGGNANDIGTSVAQNYDSSYVLVGGSNSNKGGDITAPHGAYDFWMAKIDKSGGLLWQKSLGGSLDDFAQDIKVTLDSGFVITGHSKSADGDVTGNHGGWDYWVVKLNQLGNLQWQKNYGGSGDDVSFRIQTTKDKGYVIGGYTASADGEVTGYHGNNDYWIIKLNTDSLLRSDSLLPVTLIKFAGLNKGNENILNWSTSNEINFDHFSVLRSEDGRLFSPIGTVKASGSGQLVAEYQFIDNNAINKGYYYRLLEADKDNRISYSRVILIKSDNLSAPTLVYPNPAHGKITISYYANVETDILLRILDMNGKIQKAQTVHVLQGANRFDIDIAKLAVGLYNIVLGNDKTQTKKIVKY